jgi:hypothetical protein
LDPTFAWATNWAVRYRPRVENYRLNAAPHIPTS